MFSFRERCISCSFSRKFGLVKLCELAVELTLEVIPTDDEGDYKVMDIKRRTVEENGVNVIIPSPTDDITWYKRLTSLPDIQTCDILGFFMTYCKWDSHRLQSYKNDNGFRLFSSNHIEHVQISETFQNNYLYIKSDCIPETRQTSDPYKTWVSTSVRTNCVWRLYLCCVSFMFKYCIYIIICQAYLY